MTHRRVRTPKDPQLIAEAAVALRTYADGAPTTQFETDFANEIAAMGLTTADAADLVVRWDGIPARVRLKVFGDIGLATHLNGVEPRRDGRSGRSRSRIRVPATVPIGGGTVRRRIGPAEEDTHDTDDDVVLGEPNPPRRPVEYLVTYEGLHCIDETGWDRAGSDEPYVLTTWYHIDANGQNQTGTVRHPFAGNGDDSYGDVDSHNTRIGPRAAVWLGTNPGVRLGVSFMTTFMEHTLGDPEQVQKQLEKAVRVGIAALTIKYPFLAPLDRLEEFREVAADFIYWMLEIVGLADTPINDSTVVVYEFDELDELSRRDPINYTEKPGVNGTSPTGLRYNFTMFDSENDYVAGYRVRRTPRLPRPVPPDVE